MAGSAAWICGVGMVTPVGLCTAQTVASVRAGISRYEESSIYNRRFEPMTLALVPEDELSPLNEELARLPDITVRQARMLRLSDQALKEAIEPLPKEQSIALFLSAPEPMPARPPVVTDEFLDHLMMQTGASLDLHQSKLFHTGRAGGLEAIGAAIDLLAEGEQDYVLIGGVDSHLDLYLLGALDMEDRVLAGGVMDGFVPGEGAAFLLLGSESAKQALGLRSAAKVLPPGLAKELGHRYSDQPYTGDGLAEAVGLALEKHAGGAIRTVFGSLNGENFGAKEWGVGVLRNRPSFDEEFRFEHPADCLGDTGAAVGPLLVGLAAVGLEKSYVQGPCLAWCSAEGERRSAVCIIFTAT